MPSSAEKSSIFIQIASYRDPECQWTIKNLFKKADRPERIHVGVCWQCYPEQDQDCFKIPSPYPAQTRVISVRPENSGGVCWARAKAQTLFQNEDYILMIDSHMRFAPGWDTALINELSRCPSPKAFLSTYPPGYKLPDKLEEKPLPVVMRARTFTEAGDIRFEGESLTGPRPEKPLRGAFLAAGFIFAPGAFLKEVPYDPFIYFDHEEVTLAARAFTQGWDVYSPVSTFVYHYYYEPDKGESKALHWKDNKNWEQHQKLSRARYNFLLAGVYPSDPGALIDIDQYGLGEERSLKEYEEFSGIFFQEKKVTARARFSQFAGDLDKYRT